MQTKLNDYNEIDLLYTLMTYINVSSSQDMYYTIALTILNHLEEIPNISINDLADMCYTSPATISRFCKDLNCKNFAAFKRGMAQALALAEDEIHLREDTKHLINDNPQYLIDKIYDDTVISLQMARPELDIKKIDEVVKLIHDAKSVHMFGYQFSRIVCNDFQLKMLKLKKFIYAFVNRGNEIQKLETIEENELVIIVTVSARKELIDSLVRKVKEYKPKILVVTMNKNYTNPLVDYYYYLTGKESDYTQSAMMGTVDMMTLFNVIYVRYGLLYGNE